MRSEHKVPSSDKFEIWENLPESKLELIGGRLCTGNNLAGSRYLLWALLQTLAPRAALAFAPLESWWSALATTFGAPASLSTSRAWERWAEQVVYEPRVAAVGPHRDGPHYHAYDLLLFGVYGALREQDGTGYSTQRFGLRLGDDFLTPDLQCYRVDHLHHLTEYYYDGPADLVIEVVLPGHEAQDRDFKRRLYGAGGVPEYWIVDPTTRQIEFLRLMGKGYEAQQLDPDGRYHAVFPALVCDPRQLWKGLDEPMGRHIQNSIITVERTSTIRSTRVARSTAHDRGWAVRPFVPHVGRQPVAIKFDQFIDWCPEAKFEYFDDKPQIGGWKGTRNVFGMLLLTFGLDEAVKLLPPQAWVAALLAEEAHQAQDVAQRDAWWNLAREAAELLREQFGVQRIAVIGDLVRPQPLNFWSEITLVVSPVPQEHYAVYQTLRTLSKAPRIQTYASEETVLRQVATEAIEL